MGHEFRPGPEEEFEDLYRTYEPKVRQWAARWVPRSDVDDVVADVFVVLWGKLTQGVVPRFAWFKQVLRHKVGDRIRRHQAWLPLEEGMSRAAGREFHDAVLLCCVVATSLQKLDAADREALRLTYWEGLDCVSAAQRIEVSPATFRKRLSRARARAAALIQEVP